MPRLTPQAESLRDLLLEAGLERSAFTLGTETVRRRDPYTGLRFREYGDAVASSRIGREEEMLETAPRIAELGGKVTVHKVDGRIITIGVREVPYGRKGYVKERDYTKEEVT